MFKWLKFLLIFSFAICTFFKDSKAASDADCAIWLCLPGGFPTGCSAARSAFEKRIEKGRPPLPDLSSCTTGPDGKGSNGRYETGHEYFEPCKKSYLFRKKIYGLILSGVCERKICGSSSKDNCQVQDSYNAIKRSKSSYVKIWVDDRYLGQFFY